MTVKKGIFLILFQEIQCQHFQHSHGFSLMYALPTFRKDPYFDYSPFVSLKKPGFWLFNSPHPGPVGLADIPGERLTHSPTCVPGRARHTGVGGCGGGVAVISWFQLSRCNLWRRHLVFIPSLKCELQALPCPRESHHLAMRIYLVRISAWEAQA